MGELRKLLGHSDISFTASTYAHIDVEPSRIEDKGGAWDYHGSVILVLETDVQESKVDRLQALRISRDRTALRGGENCLAGSLLSIKTKIKVYSILLAL